MISLRRPPTEAEIAALEQRVETKQSLPAGAVPPPVAEAPPELTAATPPPTPKKASALGELSRRLDRTMVDHGIAPPIPPPSPPRLSVQSETIGEAFARVDRERDLGATGRLRIIERKGRIRGDGTRTDAPARARLTIYVAPDLAMELDRQATEARCDRSTMIERILREHLSRRR